MRWVAIISLALLVCLTASKASSGRIFGDIKIDGKPVPAGITLKIAFVRAVNARGAELKPTAVLADSAVTDAFGSYKLVVKDLGKCILTLLYEKQALTLEVFSYKDPTRYDLIIEKQDRMLFLKRK